MKLTLRFDTAIGPRVGVLEVSDAITAQAILNAHMGKNHEADEESPCAALVEEMPRLSMKEHLARHRKAKAKKPKLVSVLPANVHPIKSKARGRG